MTGTHEEVELVELEDGDMVVLEVWNADHYLVVAEQAVVEAAGIG